MAAMFDLPVIRMSESIPPSLIVLLDPKFVGVAVELSLLSYIQAEISDIACVLPVDGGHLGFTSHPTSESIHRSLTVLMDAENVGVTVRFPLLATFQDL